MCEILANCGHPTCLSLSLSLSLSVSLDVRLFVFVRSAPNSRHLVVTTVVLSPVPSAKPSRPRNLRGVPLGPRDEQAAAKQRTCNSKDVAEDVKGVAGCLQLSVHALQGPAAPSHCRGQGESLQLAFMSTKLGFTYAKAALRRCTEDLAAASASPKATSARCASQEWQRKRIAAQEAGQDQPFGRGLKETMWGTGLRATAWPEGVRDGSFHAFRNWKAKPSCFENNFERPQSCASRWSLHADS